MTEWPDVIVGEQDEWIGALPEYQQRTVSAMLQSGKTPEEVAELWLSSSSPTNTAPLGAGATGHSVYYEKFLDELQKFFCDEKSYVEEKKKVVGDVANGKTAIVGGVSAAIGKAIGVVGIFLGPAVAMTLVVIAKMGINAWCAARQALKLEP